MGACALWNENRLKLRTAGHTTVSPFALRAKCASTINMRALRKNVVPRKKGRPITGRVPVTAIRLSPELRKKVDDWAAGQVDKPARSEAVCRLVELGLASAGRARVRNKKAAKAYELAGREIDRLIDPLATDEERQLRKRRLLKGPRELRDK